MIMFARTVIYYLDDPCSLGGGRRAADEPGDHLPAAVHLQPAPGRHQPRLHGVHRPSEGNFIWTLGWLILHLLHFQELPYEIQEMVMSSLGKVSSVAYDMAREGPGLHFRADFVMVCGIVTTDEDHPTIPCRK